MIFPPIYIIPVPRANKSTATCKYIYYIPSKLFTTIEKNIPTEFLIPIALFKEAYVKRNCIYPILDPSSTINFKEDGTFTLFRLQAPRHLCPSLPGYRREFLGVPLPSW